MSRTRQSARHCGTTTDPHLVALLAFIAGSHADREFLKFQIREAERAAHTLLTSYPLVSTFDEEAQRPNPYEQLTATIERWTTRADATPESRRTGDVIRALNTDDNADVPISEVYSLSIEYGLSGMFLGAALMYQMLKGGAR